MSGAKLSAIDKNLREAVDFCVSSGLSREQISRSATPLLTLARKSNRRRWVKRTAMLSLFIAVVAFTLQNTWTFKWMSVAGKYIEKKLLPYWDWTVLYEEECIFRNPYMVQEELTEDDCGCDSLFQIAVVNKLTADEVSDEYLFDNIPFVVTDATQNWKALAEFNSDFIKKLYTNDEVMRSNEVCQYKTENDNRLSTVLSGQVDSFHTFWFNCKLAAVKVFRRFYHRPYFLPPMVESATENFVAFSSGWNTHERTEPSFMMVNAGDDLTWFAQMSGSYLVELRPHMICKDICHKLRFELVEGQTVVLTNALWDLWFAPTSNLSAVAIGSTGNWDSN